MADGKTIGTGCLVKATVLFLSGIGLIMAVRRLYILSNGLLGSNPFSDISVDQEFSKHAILTLLHIIPGMLFMILGPFQFMPGFRSKHIKVHRWIGRVFMIGAYIIGITAMVFPLAKPPMGGIAEGAASITFSILFLACLTVSLRYALARQKLLHREWMIRAFSLGLAISTIRLITVSVFALFSVPPQHFIGSAFWIGFTLHLLAAEIWIYLTRQPIAGL